ncbi:MAG: hypothetical protein US31_C0009G0025 [Berkelbacteria bacterium GW2011_GWA1_36_9]|uniref:Uncharacterized protein n=1 Tax=Berkelbacteria bacterium GW2011_GWA1_36_9 TaxID=1618331 RepID=A0A0G0IQ57_9BACT|nr:MAG: hypothetical protein US31_C0009G0025 [Berkelbacteria bacterium GW2011_GWA1_36_9]
MSKNLFIKSHKGFTLIEILIATSILVMVGVAAIGVERNFMGSASVNKHKLQATGLAQEGISAVRVIYNNHLLGEGKPALPEGSNTIIYYLDANNALQPCPGNNCDKNTTNVNWNIPQNNVTFTRTITIPDNP